LHTSPRATDRSTASPWATAGRGALSVRASSVLTSVLACSRAPIVLPQGSLVLVSPNTSNVDSGRALRTGSRFGVAPGAFEDGRLNLDESCANHYHCVLIYDGHGSRIGDVSSRDDTFIRDRPICLYKTCLKPDDSDSDVAHVFPVDLDAAQDRLARPRALTKSRFVDTVRRCWGARCHRPRLRIGPSLRRSTARSFSALSPC
jgi:hypothetical protein